MSDPPSKTFGILSSVLTAVGLGWLILEALAPAKPVRAPRRARPPRSPAPPRPAVAPVVEPTCAATTRDGRPCSRPALAGSPFCWQHRERR